MSETTFQKLIDSQKFWQKVQTGATIATSTILGGLIASQASNTSLVPSAVAKVIGGVAALSGYWHGYQVNKEYEQGIATLEDLKELTSREGLFLATADIEDITDVSTWTNIAMIDENNIDTSTGHTIEGTNAKKISNPFTLQAIVKLDYDQNNNMSYIIVGKEIQESDSQLMSRFIESESGVKVYSNEIIEDIPIIRLTAGNIYTKISEKYGYHADGQAFLVKALALKLSDETMEAYVAEKLETFSTSFMSFYSYATQKNNEKARLETEYKHLQSISKDYTDRLQEIKPMQRDTGEDSNNSSILDHHDSTSDINLAGDHYPEEIC
jgi:hypothetical protein